MRHHNASLDYGSIRRTGLAIGLALGCMLLLIAPRHAEADMPFSSANILLGTADGASSVITVDLDRDGDLDVVATRRWDDSVTWWENPTWTAHTVATGFTEAYQVCTGDFNGDGWPDLAGAARMATGTNVRWWANPATSGGSWAETDVSLSMLQNAYAIDAGDVDHDGHDDIVAAGYHSAVNGVFIWFRNRSGAGTIWDAFDISTGYSTPHGVDLGDVDGDQDLDLIGAVYADDQVLWFENTGIQPSPDPWPEHIVRLNVDGALAVRGADMDHDGDLDIAVGAFEAGELQWYESSGGDSPYWDRHIIASSFAGAYSVQPVDMDNDGDIDLLAAARTDDDVTWWERIGSSWYERTIDGSFDGARSVAAADLDHDGDLDVVAAGDAADDVAWWENRMVHRNATYSTSLNVSYSAPSTVYAAVGILDADVDGDLDIVAISSNSDTSDDVTLFEQGSLISQWSSTTIEDSLDGASSLRIADIDDDGIDDVLVAATGAGRIVWYKSYGSIFSSALNVASPFAGATDVEVADIDLDGDLDVIGVSESAGQLRWWQGALGTTTPWTERGIASLAGATAVAAGDLDGDHDIDLAVVSASLGNLRWYENLGDSGGSWLWATHTLATALEAPRSVEVGDLSGDGLLDIAVGEGSGSTDLLLWINNGGSPQTWTQQTFAGPTGATGGTSQLETVDIDLDGDLDVIAALGTDQPAVQWINDGSGTLWQWSQIKPLVGSAHPLAIAAGDVDADGDPDPVLAGDDDVILMRNQGGQFRIFALPGPGSTVIEGENVLLYTIIPEHLGRTGDVALELEWLNLGFEDAAGDPLTETDINDLIERLYLFLDTNENGTFDWGVDGPLVVESPISTASPGYVQLSVPHGQVNPSILPMDYSYFFLVAEIATGASTASPSCFRVVHKAGGTVTPLRYELYQMSPRAAYFSAQDDSLLCAQATPTDLIFADGFESGDLSAW